MALPLYLAVSGAEISACSSYPRPMAYMACHFSPYTQGITNAPKELPSGSMLILTDRTPCQGHSPDLVIRQLQEIITSCGCESLLLDFQRPAEPECKQMVDRIVQAVSCPVGVTQAFADDLNCPVFLSPTPLHIPLDEYLAPWKHREIWLEAALSQEEIIVTKEGAEILPRFPADGLADGIYDEELHCHYHIEASSDRITFMLFETFRSLEKKLELAQALGVTQAVGLWQELGTFLSGK